MLLAKKVLFPRAGKKVELEETELAERLHEHLWLASGYLPAFPDLFVGSGTEQCVWLYAECCRVPREIPAWKQ